MFVFRVSHDMHAQTVLSLADGNVGEIWIGGQSRAAGYWSQPEKTAEDFGARLADAVEVH